MWEEGVEEGGEGAEGTVARKEEGRGLGWRLLRWADEEKECALLLVLVVLPWCVVYRGSEGEEEEEEGE